MKIMVTGGAGYLGTALIQLLSHLPTVNEILIFDNLNHGRRGLFLGESFGAKRIRFVRGDILNTRLLEKEIKGVDVIFHLAAKVSTPFAVGDPHSFEQNNHWGSAELSYAIETSSVSHVVYVSSAAVYGFSEKELTTVDYPQPRTWYGTSKLRGESMFLRLSPQRKVHVLRCANVYGYSPSIRFDAVINRFAWQAHFEGRLTIEGDGSQSRPFIHINEAAQAMIRLLSSDVPTGIYNLIGFNQSILELTNVLQTIYPKLERMFVEQDMPRQGLRVLASKELGVQEHDIKDDLFRFTKQFSFSA